MQHVLLIVNTGSTSIKTRLFDASRRIRADLTADCAALPTVVVKGRDWHGKEVQETLECGTMNACLRTVFERWRLQLEQLSVALLGVGHRIVHGGNEFKTLTLLDTPTLQRLALYDGYAPLHNPINRLGVEVAWQTFPTVPQYGVFDTAFHRSMPEYAQRYAVPQALAGEMGIQRYGFHGIACRQVLGKTARFLNRAESTLNLIVLHLGGGASATAIRGGASVDTSMGFSPLEGLMMASRCGDIDPVVPLMLLQRGMSAAEVERILNRDSGLSGICGTADMRVALARAQGGDRDAELAIDMYCYRIKKYIGAYAAILGRLDVLAFSGGVGENAAAIRARVLSGLEPLGLVLDQDANGRGFEDVADIGATHGSVRILAVRVNEEEEIAGQIAARFQLKAPSLAPQASRPTNKKP